MCLLLTDKKDKDKEKDVGDDPNMRIPITLTYLV